MSEPMFPSPDGQQAAAATGAPVAEGGTSKALLALGGIGAALVVGAGAFFLLNSGGSSPEAIPVPVQPQASAPAAEPSAPAVATPVARPAAASVTGRDPFKPLFASSVGGTGITVTAGGGGGGGNGGGGGGGGATAAPAPAPAPAAPTVTLSVSKIDEAGQSATVGVDGKKYDTTVNAPFGKYYTVYAIFNDSCVGVLYGDQSVAVCTTKPMTVTP